ncbi:MAG TPA: DNA methyltransferase [Chitinophagales bacterium]|nr:DNA methyltransferase [Chitinophagales bacterium]
MLHTSGTGFKQFIKGFKWQGSSPTVKAKNIRINGSTVPVFEGEFWTAAQRQANAIHEVSYRACFKPQLPGFFINFFTVPGQLVLDPFNGRGTTAIQAALMGRNIAANDVNPLSLMLTRPRIEAPVLAIIEERLNAIDFARKKKAGIDLSMFYHPKTEAELLALKQYLAERKNTKTEDAADRWIRMVATNRLTGHSKGFFSVYTLPPNQAVSASRQVKINKARALKPEYRDVKGLILRKSKGLLKNMDTETYTVLKKIKPKYMNGDAGKLALNKNTVQLTVTSPPFLDVVQYAADNWLRCWFNDIDVNEVAAKITMSKTVDEWGAKMGMVFKELYRVTAPGGAVAFEVGEVRGGKVKLDETVIPLGIEAGFECLGVIINTQSFTKTANIWGINNNRHGTNTNRIVVFRKD